MNCAGHMHDQIMWSPKASIMIYNLNYDHFVA